MAYRVQATIFKYGHIFHTYDTLNGAKIAVHNMIEMLKIAPEKTYKNIEILNTETGQVINAWNNDEKTLFYRQNCNAGEPNVIPHYLD